MKKIFAIAIIISVALVSCKKSSTPGIGTSGIQATVGNTTTVFNVLAEAAYYTLPDYYDNTDTTYSFNITAYNQGNSQPFINLAIVSNQPIAAGAVFSDTANNVPDYNYNWDLRNSNGKSTNYYYYTYEENPSYTANWLNINYGINNDPNNISQNYTTAGVISSPTTLTITAISATSISGTFQGTIYINNDSTGLKQVVTNGKFIAPIINHTQDLN